jgi:hypothetical protein
MRKVAKGDLGGIMLVSLTRSLCWFALVLFGTFATSFSAVAQNKIALVIGNSNYSSLPVLANPANDAKLLGDNLTKLGFTVTAATDQSQSQMKSAIANFTQSVSVAGADTIALVYYAGHGVQIEGTNYLVPVDANVNTAGDVVLGAVSASDLLKALELANAKVNVLVLDACRNNPFKSNTRGFSRGLARVDAPQGSIVAYSTAPGQVAADGEGNNSPYAEALIRNLTTPGLALESVFRQVRIEVSERTTGAQVPWEETSLTQEVVLSPAIVKVVEQAQPTPPQSPSVNLPEFDSARAYLVAVGTNTIDDYLNFLKLFPTAKETPQAMRNIEMLADEKNWREATKQNTLGAYKIYMNLHPQGSYVTEAQNQIVSLTPAPTPPATPPKRVFIQPQIIPQAPETMIESQGFDLFGTDLKPVRNVTFRQCRDLCAGDQSCVAVTYRSDLERCFPKSKVKIMVHNSKSDAAVKQSARARLRLSDFDFFPQYDVHGLDYADTKTNDAQSCLAVCEKDSNCKSFAFATKNKTCYLKSTALGVTDAPAVVSGIRN